VAQQGGQGVAQLVWGDVADAGGVGDFGQGLVDVAGQDRPAAGAQEHAVGAQVGGPLGDPLVEQGLQVGVEWDGAVVVELGEQVGLGAGRAEQLGGGRVVEEPRQGTVDDGQVGVEDQRPGRGVGVAPLGDAGKEASQVD
jgi:hypothetical protein